MADVPVLNAADGAGVAPSKSKKWLIIGIVAFIAIAVLVLNLLVDISYGFLDPRIRYE